MQGASICILSLVQPLGTVLPSRALQQKRVTLNRWRKTREGALGLFRVQASEAPLGRHSVFLELLFCHFRAAQRVFEAAFFTL